MEGRQASAVGSKRTFFPTYHTPTNNVLAIDIGGTHFRVGLFDHEGRRLVISEGDTLRSGGP